MIKKLCLALAAMVVALLSAELLHRGYLSSQGRPYRLARQRLQLEQMIEREEAVFEGQEPTSGRKRSQETGPGRGLKKVLPHPFFGFYTLAKADNVARDVKLSISRGRQGELRVLVLGGSVAAGFGNHGARPLEKALRRDPRFRDQAFFFLPYGVAAFKQPQQLNLFNYLLAIGMEFDWVINLDGFNEVALSSVNYDNGVHPIFPSYSKWASLNPSWVRDEESLELVFGIRQLRDDICDRAERALTSPMLYSSILAGLLQESLTRKSLRASLLQEQFIERRLGTEMDEGLTGPEFGHSQRDALAMAVRAWQGASSSIAMICEARDIRYFNVLQPTLHDVGSKPITEEERKKGKAQAAWLRATKEGYPMLRAAGQQLAQSGVSFFDATQVFKDVHSTLYYDACHFNRRGNALLAEAIAGYLLSDESLDVPSSARPKTKPVEASVSREETPEVVPSSPPASDLEGGGR